MASDAIYTFLYGTLQSGESNHHVLKDARFIKQVLTLPSFELIDLGEYPALVEGGRTAIEGELWEISGEQLTVLDRFEGVPHLYRRVTVELEDRTRAEAYVWAGDHSADLPRISGGSWKKHISLRGPKTARRTSSGSL
jgi:gamma-glutamylcyclotransferase (GGCT)/AIG2-like uncharacterized protein YtfP